MTTTKGTQSGSAAARTRELLSSWQIRELVEEYPLLMPVLAGYELDLCCGGEHTLAEAAELHEIDLEELLDAVSEALGGEEAE